jgi:hypothetical protein
MDLFKKKTPDFHYIQTSHQRKIYDLEHESINHVIWQRERNNDLLDYFSMINLENLPKKFIIGNSLDEQKLEEFFKEFPKDPDEFRKGHELLKEDILGLLKLVTPLNPKRYIEIKFVQGRHQVDLNYAQSEINLICPYIRSTFFWIENSLVAGGLNEKSMIRQIEDFHVSIFKGINYPGSLSPLIFKHDGFTDLTLCLNSYLAEH